MARLDQQGRRNVEHRVEDDLEGKNAISRSSARNVCSRQVRAKHDDSGDEDDAHIAGGVRLTMYSIPPSVTSTADMTPTAVSFCDTGRVNTFCIWYDRVSALDAGSAHPPTSPHLHLRFTEKVQASATHHDATVHPSGLAGRHNVLGNPCTNEGLAV